MGDEQGEDIMYVAVSNPLEARRNVLLSSKQVILFLKRHDTLNTIRTEKLENIMKLRRVMKEIEALSNKLKAQFPKAKMKEIHIKEKRKPEAETTDMFTLEKELTDIEKKLQSL